MKKFWIRFIITAVFAFIAPITYLIIRYNLFQPTTKLQVGLWGIVVLVILFFCVKALITFYLEGVKTKYTYWKQIISGFTKVIFPLIIALLIVVLIKDNIILMVESLSVIICCEVIAICVNPLPKWAFDNNIEGLTEIVSKITNKQGGNK